MARADSAESRIATLTAQAEQTPDPAKYVTMAAHSQIQNALAALTAQFEQKERDAMMAAALADGRILAAQDAYWRAQPVAALKAYLDVAQPLAALVGTQTGGKEPAGATDASLDAAQIAICSAMGIDPKSFAKTLAK
jgi:phage I-like protein